MKEDSCKFTFRPMKLRICDYGRFHPIESTWRPRFRLSRLTTIAVRAKVTGGVAGMVPARAEFARSEVTGNAYLIERIEK